MKLIKPRRLGCLHKSYRFKHKNYFVSAPVVFFDMGIPGVGIAEPHNPQVMDEFLQWPIIQEQLQSQVLDMVMPKPKAEVLMVGTAQNPQGLSDEPFTAGLKLGSIDKHLKLYGEREFKKSLLGYSLTDPSPTEAVTINDSNSYGGEGFEDNPAGCGFFQDKKATPLRAPCIEHPNKAVKSINGKYMPEGFGALGLNHRLRKQYNGDYSSKQWLEQHFPDMAPDTDFHLFQAARPEQWFSSYLQGGEQYTLYNMVPGVPEFTGTLPTVRPRAFIFDDAEQFSEIELNLDTLWLFPDISVGACIYHGQIEVNTLDSLDVQAHMMAFENSSDSPRSQDYYLLALQQRLDPATAIEAMSNESQLCPAKSAEQLAAEEQEIQDEIDQRKALQEAHKQQFLEDVKEHNDGELPSGIEAPEMPEPKVLVAQKAIERGDFDAKKLIDDAKMQQAEAEKKRKEMEKELEEAQKMSEQSMQGLPAGALDDMQPKGDVSDQMASLQDMAQESNLKLDEAHMQLLQEQQFKAQQYSLEPISDWPDDAQAQEKRAIFVAALNGKEPLAKRNWAGADLSNLNLDNVDLSACNLENCRLHNTSLKGANLHSSALLGCKVTDSRFTGANLQECNFSSCVGFGNDFSGTNLHKAWFIKANFRNCNFNRSNLQQAIVSEAAIVKSSFRDTQLSTFCLANSNISDNDFSGSQAEMLVVLSTDLSFSQFHNVKLSRSAFLDSNLCVASFAGSKLEKCQFAGTTVMSSANFSQASLVECGLRRVSAVHLQAAVAEFKLCDLGDSDLKQANFKQARLIQCILSEARLQKASLSEATLYGSLLRQTYLMDCQLLDCDFYQSDAMLAFPFGSNFNDAHNLAPLTYRRWQDAVKHAA